MAVKLSKSVINSFLIFVSEKKSSLFKEEIKDHGVYLEDKILSHSYERVYQGL
jgi:hypothetical protein